MGSTTFCGLDRLLFSLIDTHHTRCMSLGVLREHCAPRALCLALQPPFRPPNPPNDLLTRPIHPIDRSVAPDRALNRSHTRSNRTQGPVNVLRSSVNAIRAADGEPPPAAATSSPPRAPIHMAGRDASSCDPRSRTSGPSVRSPSQPPRLASSVLGRVGRTDGCCGGVHPSTGRRTCGRGSNRRPAPIDDCSTWTMCTRLLPSSVVTSTPHPPHDQTGGAQGQLLGWRSDPGGSCCVREAPAAPTEQAHPPAQARRRQQPRCDLHFLLFPQATVKALTGLRSSG